MKNPCSEPNSKIKTYLLQKQNYESTGKVNNKSFRSMQFQLPNLVPLYSPDMSKQSAAA